MKFFKVQFCFLSVACLLAGVASGVAFGEAPAGYHPVWGDEFNHSTLDTDKWVYRTGPALESYQRAENVSLVDGSLRIELKQESYGGKSYTGGGVIGRTNYQYGYFETRAKMSQAAGWHEAFWSTYTRDAGVGETRIEIDCFEQKGTQPSTQYTYGVMEWPQAGGYTSLSLDTAVSTVDLSDDYHTYGFEVTPDYVKFNRDGQVLGTTSMTGVDPWVPFNNWLTCIATDPNADASGEVLFDYMRVYSNDTEPAAHYTFKETAPGTWDVLLDVYGDTAGLAGYEIWVDGVDPTSVTYAENTLGGVGVGFASGTLVQGDVGGNFNAGNYQGTGAAAIDGIGMVEVNESGVVLDAQALLGTLTTEEGLFDDNFRVLTVGLLNAAGDGYLSDLPTPTVEVIPFTFLLGDANGDGVVSAGDYASVQANFGNTGSVGGGLLGDANGDGVVSAGDYASVQANFGNTSSSSVVPEPATMSLLVVGIGALLRRKRK